MQSTSKDSIFYRKQTAVRKLMLMADGSLNPGAKILALELKRLCTGPMTRYDSNGAIDPLATVAASQRREVWDHFVRLLNLDYYSIVNLRGENDHGD